MPEPTRLTSLKVGDPTAATIDAIRKIAITGLNLDSIAAQTCPETAVAVTGIQPGDVVLLTPPANLNAGLVFGPGYCRVAGTMIVRIANVTSNPIDAVAGDWTGLLFRAA